MECKNCSIETIEKEIAACKFECVGGPLKSHRGYVALLARANHLQAKNDRLKKVILLAPGSDEKNFIIEYRKWWDAYCREIRSPGCNLLNIEQALEKQ